VVSKGTLIASVVRSYPKTLKVFPAEGANAHLSERIMFMPRVQTLFLSAMFAASFAAPVVHAQALGCTTQSLQLAQQQLSKTIGYITLS
jgi:hypothetical protein